MDERDHSNDQADREAAEAAAEAGAIGGSVERDTDDPAQRAVIEGGGGESEGFEIAERELQEHASHDHQSPDPEDVAARPEAESDRATAVDGEADAVRSTERADED